MKSNFDELQESLLQEYGNDPVSVMLSGLVVAHMKCHSLDELLHLLPAHTQIERDILGKLGDLEQKLYSNMLHTAKFVLPHCSWKR